MARSKGQGSISLRKDGVYMGRITKNGFTKVFYSKDKKKVENQLVEYARMSAMEFSIKNNSVKFQDYINTYLYTYKYGHIKDSSFDRLERVYDCHIKDTTIGRVSLCDLDDVVVQQYLNEKYTTGLSMSQCKKIYDLVRGVLYYAYRRNDIVGDYGGLLRFPNSSHFKDVKVVERYSDNEIKKISDFVYSAQTKKERRFVRYAPIYIFMFHTGLRAGEVLALEWSDIDMNNKVVHIDKTLSIVRDRNNDDKEHRHYKHIISHPKTEKSIRDVPLNRNALIALDALQKSYSDFDCLGKYVVCNVNGNFIRLRSFEKKMKELCSKCEVEYKGIHAIRHTFASRMIDAGVSPKIVSELLGHTNVAFTLNRYVHTNEDAKKQSVMCIENV